jgi:predicted ester cyclase
MKINLFTLIFFALISLSNVQAQEKKAGKIITEYFNYLDSGNQTGLSSLLTDDFKITAPFSNNPLDKKAWLGICQSFKTAFPDMHHEIIHWFADDNRIAENGMFKGTNTGSMMGNPPTKNKIEVNVTSLFELDGKGKIKGLNVQFDNKSFEAQLFTGIPDAKKIAEKTVRELFAAMDAGATESFSNFCSPDFTISNPFLSAPSPLSAFQGILKAQKTGFPDLKHKVVEMISDGKFVTTRGIFIGTNTGPMMGNPPTGNKVELPFLVLDEMDVNGKIKMRNVQFDSKSFETQLMAGINPNQVIESNIRTMFEAADNGDADKFLSFWSEHSHPYILGNENTREEFKNRIKMFKSGFPDIKRSADEIIITGNKVTVRGTLSGTNKGSYMGKPATNNTIRISMLGLFHIKPDGKIENGWIEFDSATLQNQLNKKAKK